MSLDDVRHVEAVAIIRALLEECQADWPADTDAEIAAKQWLTENHPPPSAYIAAMSSLVTPASPNDQGAPPQ